MTLLLQDTLVISPKTKQQVDKNTAAIAELQEKAAIAYHFKGSKPTFNDLPTTGNEVGDVWDVKDTGVNYGWTGTEWDELGPLADLEPYLTKEEATSTYLTQANAAEIYPTKTEVENALKNAGNGYDALSAEQREILIERGEYNDEKVEDGKIFTQFDGKFVKTVKTLEPGEGWQTSSQIALGDSSVTSRGIYAKGIILRGGINGGFEYSLDKGKTWGRGTGASCGYSYHLGANPIVFNGEKFIANSGTGYSTSEDGITWTWQGNCNGLVLNSSSSAWGFEYGNEVYVLSRQGYDFYYSTDAINWQPADQMSGKNARCYGFANGKFIALAQNKVYLSENGINWEGPYTIGSTNKQCCQCAGGNGVFVVAECADTSSSNKMFYSNDGVNWNTVYTPSSKVWRGLTWCGDRFVMVGLKSDTYAFSYDGVTWIEDALPTNSHWHGVVYADDTTVVTANHADYDGREMPVAYAKLSAYYSYSLEELSLNKEEVVDEISSIIIEGTSAPTSETVGVLGQLYKDTTTGLIYRCKAVDTSLPSYEWEELGSKTSGNFYRSLSSEQETVLLNAGTYNEEEVASGEIFTTELGTFGQYSSVLNPNVEFVAYPTTNPLVRIAYGNGKFVTVRNHVIVYSDDGINYTDTDITLELSGTVTGYYGAIFFKGKFFVYLWGNVSKTYSSEDGVVWQEESPCSFYGNELYIVCSENIAYVHSQQINRYSTDGITWTDCTQQITGITYHDGLYVGCSGDDPYYSTDGVTWTKGTGSWKNLLCDVAYGNGIFVAISSSPYGGDTEYAISSDGIAWTTYNTMPVTNNDTYKPKIIFASGKFVVVRNGNVACYSEDGITWTSVTIPEWSGNNISLVYGKDKYIATRDYSGTHVNVLEFGVMIRTLEPLSYSKSEVDALLNQAYVTASWTIPLPVADWVENKQTFTIQGLSVDSSVDLNPVVPTTREEMIKLSNAGLFISALGENSVTIECMNLPTEDLVVRLKREMTTNLILDGINVQLAEINGV